MLWINSGTPLLFLTFSWLRVWLNAGTLLHRASKINLHIFIYLQFWTHPVWDSACPSLFLISFPRNGSGLICVTLLTCITHFSNTLLDSIYFKHSTTKFQLYKLHHFQNCTNYLYVHILNCVFSLCSVTRNSVNSGVIFKLIIVQRNATQSSLFIIPQVRQVGHVGGR